MRELRRVAAMSSARAPLYPCDGDRPWLGGRGGNEDCDQKLELLVRTASDAYFSQVVSALRLPAPGGDPSSTGASRATQVWKPDRRRWRAPSSELRIVLEDASAGARRP